VRIVADVDMDAFYARRGAAGSCATRSAARCLSRSQGRPRPRRRDGGELRGPTVRHPLGLADLASLAPGGGRASPGRARDDLCP
jgi:hypothetical protein